MTVSAFESTKRDALKSLENIKVFISEELEVITTFENLFSNFNQKLSKMLLKFIGTVKDSGEMIRRKNINQATKKHYFHKVEQLISHLEPIRKLLKSKDFNKPMVEKEDIEKTMFIQLTSMMDKEISSLIEAANGSSKSGLEPFEQIDGIENSSIDLERFRKVHVAGHSMFIVKFLPVSFIQNVVEIFTKIEEKIEHKFIKNTKFVVNKLSELTNDCPFNFFTEGMILNSILGNHMLTTDEFFRSVPVPDLPFYQAKKIVENITTYLNGLVNEYDPIESVMWNPEDGSIRILVFKIVNRSYVYNHIQKNFVCFICVLKQISMGHNSIVNYYDLNTKHYISNINDALGGFDSPKVDFKFSTQIFFLKLILPRIENYRKYPEFEVYECVTESMSPNESLGSVKKDELVLSLNTLPDGMAKVINCQKKEGMVEMKFFHLVYIIRMKEMKTVEPFIRGYETIKTPSILRYLKDAYKDYFSLDKEQNQDTNQYGKIGGQELNRDSKMIGQSTSCDYPQFLHPNANIIPLEDSSVYYDFCSSDAVPNRANAIQTGKTTQHSSEREWANESRILGGPFLDGLKKWNIFNLAKNPGITTSSNSTSDVKQTVSAKVQTVFKTKFQRNKNEADPPKGKGLKNSKKKEKGNKKYPAGVTSLDKAKKNNTSHNPQSLVTVYPKASGNQDQAENMPQGSDLNRVAIQSSYKQESSNFYENDFDLMIQQEQIPITSARNVGGFHANSTDSNIDVKSGVQQRSFEDSSNYPETSQRKNFPPHMNNQLKNLLANTKYEEDPAYENLFMEQELQKEEPIWEDPQVLMKEENNSFLADKEGDLKRGLESSSIATATKKPQVPPRNNKKTNEININIPETHEDRQLSGNPYIAIGTVIEIKVKPKDIENAYADANIKVGDKLKITSADYMKDACSFYHYRLNAYGSLPISYILKSQEKGSTLATLAKMA